ncbi:hypothetical protein FRC08_011242 [Ceratobasidium sp. 394]|nr:hypothetical protein FRC08_011242 [Ceratobasidium sp. 394]KAG9085892.1 hypothetical protein FS749_004037 [Ceratobasidium sp. UAMH 11750]
MDSPLTNAELSRLRKAINQRERLLSQGLSVATAESNITRALSNLKLYLSQSQTQLAAVLKDWEGADQATKNHIIIWLRQNILEERASQTETPISTPPAQSPAPQPKFVAPPPPPALPAKTQSLPPQPPPIPYSYAHNTSVSSLNGPVRNTSPRPLPTPTSSQLGHANPLRRSQTTYAPPAPMRELHTQAVLRSPTPPPKDYVHSRSASFARNSNITGVDQLSLGIQGLNIATSPNGAQPGFSTSPVTSSFLPQPEPPTPVNETRSSVLYNARPQVSNFDNRASTYPQTEPLQNRSQHIHHHHSFSFGDTNSSHPLPALPSAQSQPDLGTQLPNTAGSYQQYQNPLAQATQSTSQSTPSANTNYLLSAMKAVKKVQALASQFQSHSQASSQKPTAAGGDSFQQLLAAYQQQQQQQTNQLLAALQQQQQSTPAFDPSLILAQYQQQNQAFLNMMAQMQSNSDPTLNLAQSAGQNTDFMNMLAQMQSGTSSVDMSSLIGGGGAGVDWSSMAGMMAGGVDPNSMAGLFDTQNSGLF